MSSSRCIRSIVLPFLRKRESFPIGIPSHGQLLSVRGGVKLPSALRGEAGTQRPLLRTFAEATFAPFCSSDRLSSNGSQARKAGSCLRLRHNVSVCAGGAAGVVPRGIPLIFLDCSGQEQTQKNRAGTASSEERQGGNHNRSYTPPWV